MFYLIEKGVCMLSEYLDRAELYVKAYVKKEIRPETALARICCRCYRVTNLQAPVFGFVIKGEKANIEKDYYFFALYCKTPYHRRLFVSEEIYPTFEETCKKVTYYARCFPLFGFSSHYLIDQPLSDLFKGRY